LVREALAAPDPLAPSVTANATPRTTGAVAPLSTAPPDAGHPDDYEVVGAEPAVVEGVEIEALAPEVADKAPSASAGPVLVGPDLTTPPPTVVPNTPAATSSDRPAKPGFLFPPHRRAFDDLPLGEIARQIAELVTRVGAIHEDDLVDEYSANYGVDVPRSRQRTLRRFAWSAKGHRYIDLDGRTWIAGTNPPADDPRYGRWTFSAIVDRARDLLPADDDPFDGLLAEVYSGTRVPRLVMSIIGSAINEARKTSSGL